MSKQTLKSINDKRMQIADIEQDIAFAESEDDAFEIDRLNCKLADAKDDLDELLQREDKHP